MIPSRTDSIAAMLSTAPAAPSRCPIADFGAVSTGWSPIAARIAAASATSPTGVDVAWQLT